MNFKNLKMISIGTENGSEEFNLGVFRLTDTNSFCFFDWDKNKANKIRDSREIIVWSDLNKIVQKKTYKFLSIYRLVLIPEAIEIIDVVKNKMVGAYRSQAQEFFWEAVGIKDREEIEAMFFPQKVCMLVHLLEVGNEIQV